MERFPEKRHKFEDQTLTYVKSVVDGLKVSEDTKRTFSEAIDAVSKSITAASARRDGEFLALVFSALRHMNTSGNRAAVVEIYNNKGSQFSYMPASAWFQVMESDKDDANDD